MDSIISSRNLYFVIFFAIYWWWAKKGFDTVNNVTKMVVDEQFHLPKGTAFCELNFKFDDTKITTLPGLYYLSTVLLAPMKLCSVYFLRMVCLGCSMINVLLFFNIMQHLHPDQNRQNAITSFSLALLPPLHFFANLYYTDIPSITMVLVMYLAHLKYSSQYTFIFGLFSILMRQTNIIYVVMLAGRFYLVEINNLANRYYPNYTNSPDFLQLIRKLVCNCLLPLQKFRLDFWFRMFPYAFLGIGFGLFVLINGGIVVGDKTAHEATIHIPQLFYFSLFTLFFSWPIFVAEASRILDYMFKYQALLIFLSVAGLIIVEYNTLVHPYLLSDNRHYVFYIWNRFYGKYDNFRFLMVPVYVIILTTMIRNLWESVDKAFCIMFVISTIVVLVPQKLLELRYFLMPYIFYRLHLRNIKTSALVIEIFYYLLINELFSSTFSKKTFFWENFVEPQRIIW